MQEGSQGLFSSHQTGFSEAKWRTLLLFHDGVADLHEILVQVYPKVPLWFKTSAFRPTSPHPALKGGVLEAGAGRKALKGFATILLGDAV